MTREKMLQISVQGLYKHSRLGLRVVLDCRWQGKTVDIVPNRPLLVAHCLSGEGSGAARRRKDGQRRSDRSEFEFSLVEGKSCSVRLQWNNLSQISITCPHRPFKRISEIN